MAVSCVCGILFIDGIVDKMIYLNTLKNNLKNCSAKLGFESNFTFQWDNDSKHTAFLLKEWLLYHCRNQLTPPLPPQSPDLNATENLWFHPEKAIQKLSDH